MKISSFYFGPWSPKNRFFPIFPEIFTRKIRDTEISSETTIPEISSETTIPGIRRGGPTLYVAPLRAT